MQSFNYLCLWYSQRGMKNLLSYHRVPLFWGKYNVSPFLLSKVQGTKFDLDKKIGHGQPRITIWTNLVVLSHVRLHTKFQDNQPRGSGKEDFLRFLPYMGMAAILIPFEQIFNQPLPGGCVWNLIEIGPAVSEKKSFENVNKHSIPVTFS